MIQMQTTMDVADNSGARKIMAIRTLGQRKKFAEIGDVNRFQSQAAVAKYAGLVWTQHQSGNFEAQHTRLIKSGNRKFVGRVLQFDGGPWPASCATRIS